MWIDAPNFDIADHVRVEPLPRLADEAALLATVERLRRQRLDRSRPLWEMYLLPGLADGRVGLFVRLHHSIADGMAGVAAIGALLGSDAVAAETAWAPRPAPAARELLADQVRQWRWPHPLAAMRRFRTASASMRRGFAAQATPSTSLDRTVGPDRGTALLRARLDEMRTIARAHDATVNDVLLAAVAGGLRRLFHGRGELVDELPVYVPIALRRDGAATGNRIAQMVVPLPLSVDDPRERLRRIADATAARKAKQRSPLGGDLRGRLSRLLLLLVLRRHPVSITTADVPGPPAAVRLAGAPVLEIFPVLPLIAAVSLGVGALSYAGQFNITVVADPATYRDLDVLVAGIRAEIATLNSADPVR